MVTVVVREGDRAWEYLEPGSRGLSIGTDGFLVWWWSVRHLGVVPAADEPDLGIVEVDDDEILYAFRVNGLWLLVCELTLRLRDEVQELDRWDLPDVALDARWEGEVLVVEVMSFPETRMSVAGERFVPQGSQLS